jgi:hypothetical protein
MSSFINLTRGKRVEGLLKFQGEYRFGPSYLYIETSLAQASKAGPDGNRISVERGEAGDFITLRPSGEIDPARGYQAMIVPNGVLASVGSLSYQSILTEGDGAAFGASILLSKPFDFSTLAYLFRVYLLD